MKNKPICIIGGMGPQASAHLYNLLIQKAISDFGVKKDEEFPEIIICSVAVPNFIKSKRNMNTTLQILKNKVQELNKLNMQSLSIACNTVHLLLPELNQNTKIPFTSMINEVVKSIIKADLNCVGLLATSTTIKTGLYQELLNKLDIKVIRPSKEESKQIDKIIEDVIAGKLLKKDQDELLKIANKMSREGAGGIILGCTELPIAFPKKSGLSLFNSLEILANRLLTDYYKKRSY